MEPSSKRRGVVFSIPSVSAEEHKRADDINEMSIDEVGLHRYTSRWQEPQFGIKTQDFSQSWKDLVEHLCLNLEKCNRYILFLTNIKVAYQLPSK
ncbi:hypothetical protein M758_12G057900 [Ceratodon purpureus]|nr:hypothetical protein M758_12G057900 [Ceratodon purpureus]